MPNPRQLLDRFHRALVEEIRASHPEYLDSTFTVAEIYQNLVPYRTHRDAIGVEMNGDYEDALVRLLAGEGDFLLLESEPARRRIEAELRTSNPNTTVYREFAAAPVRLNPARVPAPTGEARERVRSSERAAATPEGAAPGRAAPVNPELGLFVADLFGGSGADRPGRGPADASSSPAGGMEVEAGAAPEPGKPEEVPLMPDSPVEPPPPAPLSFVAESSSPPAPSTPPPPAPSGSLEVASTPAPAPEADPRSLAVLLDENLRLRRIVADQALEIQRLRERLAAS